MADIDSLSIRINADTGSAVAALDRLAAMLAKINSISSKAGGAAGSTTSSMSRVGSAATKLNSILGKTGKAFSSTFNALTFIPRKVSTPFIRAVGKMGSAILGLGRQLARVAMYRALRSAIKLVTKAFSEGIENLYKWSHAFDKTFYNAMNTIATAKTYFSNSFAAMASPLIEAFAPAIDTIIDKFVEMFNIANQFFSRLVGKDTYTVARKVQTVWDDVDEDVDNTNTKIKELRKTLLGFDEINRLDKATSETTTGNSNKKPPDTTYMWMFEQRPINDAVASFADMLKEAFQKADWEGLGKLLGNALNGLLDKIDFAGLGTKLGNAITAMFTTAYWFLVTFDFTKLGEGIATLLNNAINSIDFEIVGRTLVRWFTGGVDALIAFLVEFDMGQLASKLSDFCVGVFTEIYDWFASYDNWREIGRKIGDNIAAAIMNIRYGEIWQTLCSAVDIAVESIIQLVTGALEGIAERFKEAVHWDELPKEVQSTLLRVAAIALGATFAIGAILTFSGANIPLGIGLMIGSGLLLATEYEVAWGDLGKKVDENITSIKFVLATFGFAIGALLTFSGADLPLGIGLMIGSGALAGYEIGQNWGMARAMLSRTFNYISVPLFASIGLLAIGAILAFSGVQLFPGIAMMIAGGVSTGYIAYANWDIIKAEIKRVLNKTEPVLQVSAGLTIVGALLAFSGLAVVPGIAMLAAGIGGMYYTAQANWGMIKATITRFVNNNIDTIVKVSAALVLVGTMLMLAGISFFIGLAMIAAGITGFGFAEHQNTGMVGATLKRYINENIELITVLSAGLTVVGVVLMMTGVAFGIGLAMAAAGLTGLISTITTNPGMLGAKIERFMTENFNLFIALSAGLVVIGILMLFVPAAFLVGVAMIAAGIGGFISEIYLNRGLLGAEIQRVMNSIKRWIKEKAAVVLGILSMIGGDIGRGISAVIDGVKELWQEGTENWNNLVELGKKAIEKIQEGWKKASEFTIGIKAKVDKKLDEIMAWIGIDTDNSIQNTPNDGPSSSNMYGHQGYGGGGGGGKNVIMKMSAVAGPGFTYSGGQLRPDIPNKTDIGVTIGPMYNDAGERVYSNNTLKGIGMANLKTNVGVGVNTAWSLIFGGILTFLKLTNLKTSVGVDTSDAWTKKHKSFLQYVDVVGKTTDVNVNAQRGNFKNGLGAWIGYSTHTVTVNLVRGNWYWGLSEWIGQEVWVRVNLWAGGGVVYGNGYSVGFANGGIITRSGWNHLDKAANGGTKPHGTMFVAGEAGPEIVGNIGGRTEILNKSQLASTMFASVSAAIAPAVKAFTSMGTIFAQAANEAMNASIYTIDRAYARVDAFAGNASMMDSTIAENMTEMLELMRANAEATMEQNRLLQQQNEYLRQINEKEFSADISTAAINKAQQRTNRRAGVTVVALGT